MPDLHGTIDKAGSERTIECFKANQETKNSFKRSFFDLDGQEGSVSHFWSNANQLLSPVIFPPQAFWCDRMVGQLGLRRFSSAGKIRADCVCVQ
jgi:hypothetical protein